MLGVGQASNIAYTLAIYLSVIRCLTDCSAEGITTSPQDNAAQEKLLALARTAQKLVVFSGSGLSAGSGEATHTSCMLSAS